MQVPAEPIIFMKATCCIVGPNDDVEIPAARRRPTGKSSSASSSARRAKYSRRGRRASSTSPASAWSTTFGARLPARGRGQWVKGKAPTRSARSARGWSRRTKSPTPHDLRCGSKSTASAIRTARRKTMIFGVRYLVSYSASFMSLQPGDVISTGTPPGVGMGSSRSRSICAPDRRSSRHRRLGEQRQQYERAKYMHSARAVPRSTYCFEVCAARGRDRSSTSSLLRQPDEESREREYKHFVADLRAAVNWLVSRRLLLPERKNSDHPSGDAVGVGVAFCFTGPILTVLARSVPSESLR